MSHNAWRKNYHLPVLASRPDLFYGRLETDLSNTGFWEGKEFRISHEFSVAEGSPLVFRFQSTVDFILQLQALSVDQSGIRYRAFRASQGTETGTFDTPEPIFRQNFTSQAKDLDPIATVTTGGGFDINVGASAVETIRLRTSGATSQRTTVTSAVGDERGIAAGTYYLVFDRLPLATGTDPALGVFDLKWEELRPDD